MNKKDLKIYRVLWGFKGGRKDTDMARIKKKTENRHRRVESRINTMKKKPWCDGASKEIVREKGHGANKIENRERRVEKRINT